MTVASVALAFLPELLLLSAALLVFLLDVLEVRRIEALGGVALGGILLALFFVLADLRFLPFAALATIPATSVDAAPAGAPLYAFSSLGLVFQGIFLLTACLVALASLSRESREKGAAIFFGLLLLSSLGMLLVAVASDLIFLLLAVELVSIPTYVMVGYTRRDPRGLEASMKFFIIGALSAALSFYGASLLFGAYGTTNLFGIFSSVPTVGYPTLAVVGWGLLMVGLGFKITAVPFHAWAVDVYDGAPTEVSGFLAGASKKTGFFAFFLVFLGPLLVVRCAASGCPVGAVVTDFRPTFQLAFGVLSVLTMTVGNVLALQQRSMKRMLAYSSISQAGYMLIGLAVGTAPALAGATFQIFAHVFMKVGAFLVVAAVASLGVGPLIDDWRGLGTRRPYLSVAFALMLLSLAGIPLTAGFFSKFVLFSSAIQAGGYFVWLAIAGLLNSALSVFYYARVLKVMFMDRPSPVAAPLPRGDVAGAADPPILAVGGLGYGRALAIFFSAVALIAFGLYPQPVLGVFQSAAQHFLATGA